MYVALLIDRPEGGFPLPHTQFCHILSLNQIKNHPHNKFHSNPQRGQSISSHLQLAIALQQQEFEQQQPQLSSQQLQPQPQRNLQQPAISGGSRLITGPQDWTLLNKKKKLGIMKTHYLVVMLRIHEDTQSIFSRYVLEIRNFVENEERFFSANSLCCILDWF
ncbi:MINDY deubiquitinase domain-containing protein [Forsythia ovata]|uniref:MINDY deubiquitinase domain-containing protein n=1 Tax=Forsythia ovata TaxID=205694 RepID=A0ABD1WLI2_9LAMI